MLPEYDAVIAATSESFNMGASMKLIWDHLIPAMKANPGTVDQNAQKKLRERMKNLALDFPKADASSSLVQRISGKSFDVDQNEFQVKVVSFNFGKDSCTLTVKDNNETHKIECGINRWMDQKDSRATILFPVAGRSDIATKISAAATWSDEKTLIITQRFTETAHGDQLTCVFEDNQLTIKFLNSVSMGNPDAPEKRADLKGRTIA